MAKELDPGAALAHKSVVLCHAWLQVRKGSAVNAFLGWLIGKWRKSVHGRHFTWS